MTEVVHFPGTAFSMFSVSLRSLDDTVDAPARSTPSEAALTAPIDSLRLFSTAPLLTAFCQMGAAYIPTVCTKSPTSTTMSMGD